MICFYYIPLLKNTIITLAKQHQGTCFDILYAKIETHLTLHVPFYNTDMVFISCRLQMEKLCQ